MKHTIMPPPSSRRRGELGWGECLGVEMPINNSSVDVVNSNGREWGRGGNDYVKR